MDTYENNFPHSEDAQPQEQSAPQYGYTAPKKPSPFADSPYVMPHEPQNTQSNYTNTAPQAPQKRSSAKGWKGITAVLLAAALVVGSCGVTAAMLNAKWEKRMEKLTLYMNEKVSAMQDELESSGRAPVISGDAVSSPGGYLTPAQVYAQCKNTVVAITNEAQTTGGYFGQAVQTTSSGSGFILSSDGYIVSNHHVVDGADKLTVTTYDGVEYEATLVGSDETNDIALLKVEAQDLPAADLGSSDGLLVGDQVVAIGNPLGELTSTQTVGYISGKDRSVSTDGSVINMLQTDAAINSGNSGGPLFNMYGQVVGITTAKYSGTTSSGASIEGIGFAIPLDDVLDMLEDLKNFGYITGAYLGISCYDSSAYTNLPAGVFIDSVTPGSCAERGGILAWDIIVELGGYEIENTNDLTRALRKFSAGDTVTITVYRSGKEVLLTVTLDEKPQQNQTQPTVPEATEPAIEPSVPKEGSYDEWFDFFFPNIGG